MAIFPLSKSNRYATSLSLVTGPTKEPVKLNDFKTFIRQKHSSEARSDKSLHLESYLIAAREQIEKRFNIAIIEQTWKLSLDAWPTEPSVTLAVDRSNVIIPKAPLISIVDPITILDSDGSTLDTLLIANLDYEYDTGSIPGILVPASTPGSNKSLRGIEIQFKAGFGTDEDSVPGSIKLAIMTWAGKMYKSRNTPQLMKKKQNVSLLEVPDEVMMLIEPYIVRLP